MTEQVKAFEDLMMILVTHPDFDKALVRVDIDGQELLTPCLIDPSIIDDVPTVTECKDLVLIVLKVYQFLDQYFIDAKGQCSRLFYNVKQAGFRTRITERDSFGPLGSCVSVPKLDNNVFIRTGSIDDTWFEIYYG